MKKLVIGGFAALMLVVATTVTAASQNSKQIEETRTFIDKWVQTRQLISKTENDWREESQLLDHRIELFKTEVEQLESQISETEGSRTSAEEARSSVKAEEESLKSASNVVERVVIKYEQRLRQLAKFFPEPLVEKIDSYMAKIPNDPHNTRLTVSERMAVVIGILNEVDNFNSNITVVSEVRKFPSGEKAEVKTMYLGLGQAYYVDAKARYSAFGVPGKNGWEWTEDNEIADNVLKAIAVYENVIKPAVFVELPVAIN